MIRTLNDLKNRKLDKLYIAVYLVTYPVPIKKDECIENANLGVLYGINCEGKRRIIDIFLEKETDNRFWLEKFEHIKSRGIEKILFLVAKFDKNIGRAIKILYNGTTVVESPMEIITPLRKYLIYKREEDVFLRFRKLFLVENLETYDIELQVIRENVKEFKLATIAIDKQLPKVCEFHQYDIKIRKLLFPYYAIKDMKTEIRKIINIDRIFY